VSILTSVLPIPKIIVQQNLAFQSCRCQLISSNGHFNIPGQYIANIPASRSRKMQDLTERSNTEWVFDPIF
jgi:hypothetical protein